MTGKITGEGKKRKYFIDGWEVTKRQFDKAFPPKEEDSDDLYAVTNWTRPLRSIALAVLPDQVQEAIDDSISKGVGTNFTPDGRPEFHSRQHYNAYLKAYGFFNRDAGYGDVAAGQSNAHR